MSGGGQFDLLVSRVADLEEQLRQLRKDFDALIRHMQTARASRPTSDNP